MTSQAGYVYAIGIEGTTLVKIGRTQNVERRLAVLQAGLPYTLKVLQARWVEQPGAAELYLHGQLRDTALRGEWFDTSLEVITDLFAQPWPLLPEQPRRNAPETIGFYIGKRVRALRRGQDMTQAELALAAGLPQGHISRLERGDVDDIMVATLTSLAKALGVTREDLLAGIPDDEEEEHAALAGKA